MKKRPVKLSDVARAAKVSTATVSRALSLPHLVKPDTRARIERAVDELSYIAHGTARALASRRSRTVGAVIPTLYNAIFANTTHALQKTLDDAGYALVLAFHEFDPNNELRLARTLIERGIDGIVLVGTEHHAGLFELIRAMQIPYVLTWALDRTGRHPCVGFDNRHAAVMLTDHLLDLGHTEIAMISGLTAHNERARERLQGVREAMAARGLSLPRERLTERPYTLSSGRAGLAALMRTKPRPTAVICGNDVLAIGAIAECKELGIELPHEVSITGFDDMEISSLIGPGLTTVHFPTGEMGRIGSIMLLALISGAPVSRCHELPVRLVVRGTTAPPLAGAPRREQLTRIAGD